ncbi:MAG: UDP-N-acetylmuramate dehydrogenase [Spirochaetes bacterium]|nr:UDP-N-acetylmuramate dehydrogenase [Spirochaetota bacterium]
MSTIEPKQDQLAAAAALAQAIQNEAIDAKLRLNEAMAGHTSFQIGGPADLWVQPRSVLALRQVLELAERYRIPAQILGGGANLLVADSGIRGLVLCTAGLSRHIMFETDTTLYAGAGMPADRLCSLAAGLSLSGLEFISALPGSVGGAVFMNARCYEREIADAAVTIDYLDVSKHCCDNLQVAPAEWAYKRTPFMPGGRLAGAVVLGARFQMSKADPAEIRRRMQELRADRVAKGHFDFPSAGSMFKNNRDFGRPSGAILDELGFRGRRVGDAMVSPKHANIFVNAGQATAADMLQLVQEARRAARECFGFDLEIEVQLMGDIDLAD